jgi:hypothetical protein
VEPGSYVTGVSTSTYAFGIAYIDGFWGFGVFAADLTERIWRWDELQDLNGETAWRLQVLLQNSVKKHDAHILHSVFE